MKSPVVKRSIVVSGHKTSVSLEDAFWASMKEISISRDMTMSNLITEIDKERREGNLSSAIRLYVLGYFRKLTAGSPPIVRSKPHNTPPTGSHLQIKSTS